MEKTTTLTLPGNLTLPLVYPDSPLMAKVIHQVFSGPEYPRIPFLDTAGAAIVDIGANIGCSAILFRAQYPDATIFALEPSSVAFGFLRRNVAALPNVRPIQVGAFDRDATVPLFPGSAASVTSSMFAGGEAASAPGETIQVRRISTLLDELAIGRIALLKLDAEGAEVPILRDLLPRLDRIDSIYLEYHSEEDRLAIDSLLSQRFTLCLSRASTAHRGVCGYLAKPIIAARTQWDRFAIRHERS